MGKRELLLIAGFILLGAAIYHFTAPAAKPGEQGFSLARIFDQVQREVGGNQASAEVTTNASHPVEPVVTELRIHVLRGPITVVGEDRETVESELAVRSTGYDEPEAQELARATALKFEQTGSLLAARVEYPTPGRQTAALTLRVPARLRIRIEGPTGKLDISGVAAVEAAQVQGETTLRHVAGRVSASHRGGTLVIADAGSLKLTTRGSRATIDSIRGEAEITTQAGDLKASGIAGPLELNSNATRVEIQGHDGATGMAQLIVVSGALTLNGFSTESRIDLRNAGLDLHMDRPAEVAVFSEGSDRVRITPPAGGFRLDARARAGRVTSAPPELFATWGVAVEKLEDGTGERVAGTINGGGPLLTIRTRGDIAFIAK